MSDGPKDREWWKGAIQRMLDMHFLFNRKIACRLRGSQRRERDELLAAHIMSAIVDGSEHALNLLYVHFHPDAEQRAAAMQRWSDDFEFSCEKDIRAAEQRGDFKAAQMTRDLLVRTRADNEKQIGRALLRRATIEHRGNDNEK